MSHKFKFDKCSNHFFLGCDRRPEVIHENKEMCLVCYSEQIYQDLAFGIRYGKKKATYKSMKSKAFGKDAIYTSSKHLSSFQQLQLLQPKKNDNK